MNPRIKKIAFSKLDDDLCDSILFFYGDEIWILTEKKDNWYFKVNSAGILYYNQKSMTNLLLIFGLEGNEKNKVLKEWFELTTKLSPRYVNRINSDLSWALEKFTNESCVWDLKKRNGFAFETIKRFLTLSERFSLDTISIRNLKNEL